MKVGVIGAGAWGTALAQALASDGSEVLLWARERELVEEINSSRTNSLFLPTAKLASTIRATSDIADMANASSSPMAGCITAALFLKRYVPDEISWAHFDTFAWRDQAKPGRPKGGDALGLRAAWHMVRERYPAR